jgi:hypothetical protein
MHSLPAPRANTKPVPPARDRCLQKGTFPLSPRGTSPQLFRRKEQSRLLRPTRGFGPGLPTLPCRMSHSSPQIRPAAPRTGMQCRAEPCSATQKSHAEPCSAAQAMQRAGAVNCPRPCTAAAGRAVPAVPRPCRFTRSRAAQRHSTREAAAVMPRVCAFARLHSRPAFAILHSFRLRTTPSGAILL